MVAPNNCRHQNIVWEDFFKPEKQNNNNYHHKNAYCVDCGADKGQKVAYAIQKWYREKIEEWLKDNGLAEKKFYQGKEFYFFHGFIRFIQKNYPDFEQYWKKLQSGKIDEEYFEGILGQALFNETARIIEEICEEFKKEKQNNLNTPPRKNKNKREKERANLQSEIDNLEQKPNKTEAEQQELINKRQELDNLDNNNPTTNSKEPFNWKPVVIGLSAVAIIMLGAWLFMRNKKDK